MPDEKLQKMRQNYKLYRRAACPSCKELDEADFKRIKEYLHDNPYQCDTGVCRS